jgi:hypothetical protein
MALRCQGYPLRKLLLFEIFVSSNLNLLLIVLILLLIFLYSFRLGLGVIGKLFLLIICWLDIGRCVGFLIEVIMELVLLFI